MSAKLISMGPDLKVFDVPDYAIMGADPQCHIRLDVMGLDERVCRIQKSADKYILRDLNSQIGVYVNNTRITEAILSDCDQIKIGNLEFDFCLQDPLSPTEPFPITSKNIQWNQQLNALSSVAKTNFPVLLLGPSGTGKDVLAHAIHQKSNRANGPFVSVNCSAITETLVESELFGHVRGSFTGAIHDRKGAFEAARGGTLFLDEIGDLPLTLQSKLLRALENEEIRPVGCDKNVKTDVRVIAATHQNLTLRIREGSFRTDLYFRLNVVNVTPPPLAERMEDFDLLLGDFSRRQKVRFSPTAVSRLKRHNWPGNIRELKNLVSRAAAVFPKQYIDEEKVETLIDKDPNTNGPATNGSMSVIKEIEKQMIIKRLSVNNGSQVRTAKDLGLPKSTLHDRIRTYQIDVGQFKV